MANSYDTIVIGLGSAGATAASTLARAGRRVLALEAQDRVGGRVKTVPFGDGVVEEGAEWMHGTSPNRIYDLAIQNNIPVVEQDINIEVYRSDGKIGQSELVQELMTYCLGVIDDQPAVSEPLGQYVTRRLMDHLKQKYPNVLNDKDFVNEFLNIMNLVVDNYEASNDWNDVNARTQYEELNGHLHVSWHRYGYKTFFDLLLNTYNNGSGLPSLNIKLNKEVALIKWPRNSTGPVQVTCRDGDHYTASNVIVTVSLGVLKERYSSLFEPMLPAEKNIAIDKMSIGAVGKIILSFPEAWWPNRIAHLFFWNATEKSNLGDDEKWITNVAFTSFPKGSSNTITLWTSGDVNKLVETLPEDIVKRKSMELLRRFLGKNITIPDPTGMIRSTWFSNPFTRGSYTYDTMAMDQYPNARGTLAEPLVDAAGKPRVLFAGEATDVTHFSTVHGASDSGYREAMRLLPSSKV